ncbi:hypothetical protein [Mycetocola saprophilus]|uniref:hypothetical protein n=1 Tax=Mycetocola saprophilus TaxID=76636 RepID=UPI003BF1BC8E
MSTLINLFPNPSADPAGDMSVFRSWPGNNGNVSAVSSVATSWGARKRVAQATWTTINDAFTGDFGLNLEVPRPGRYTLRYSIQWATSQTPGFVSTWSGAGNSAGVTRVAHSPLPGPIPAWQVIDRWITIDVTAQGVTNRPVILEVFPGKTAAARAVQIADVLFYEGDFDPALTYFDGDSDPGPGEAVGWVGAPGRSASFRVTPEIDLNPMPDDQPCPRVELVARDLPPSTTAVTIWRTAAGRTKEVRGAIRTNASDAISLVDFEAPFGVPLTYRVEPFTATGDSLGLIGLAETQLDVDETWVHNPLNPFGSVVVSFRGSAVGAISRPVDGQVEHALGSRVGRVVSSGRRGVVGVSLDVMTETLADADKVAALLGDEGNELPPVLCFRIGARDRVRLPQPFYAAVLDIVESSFDYTEGTGEKIAHHMSGTEAAPPVPGLFIPLLTYAHLNAYYASYAALNADNPTYLAVNTRYDLVR